MDDGRTSAFASSLIGQRRARRTSSTGGWRTLCATISRLNGSPGAVVLSVDEKTQVQAFERTQLPLPLREGRAVRIHMTIAATASSTCTQPSTWAPDT